MRYNLFKSALLIFCFLGVALSTANAASFTPGDSTLVKKVKKTLIDKKADVCKDMANCKDSSKCKDMSKAECKMKSKAMNMDKTMKMDTKKTSKEVMSKVINLKALDKNKDGKVYQCPMDWYVISDKPGKDPKCGMDLVEVTLEQAKKNLLDHGFKVK